MTPDESKRLHLDWWGNCRTCKHWSGRRTTDGTTGVVISEEAHRDLVGTCYSNAGPFYLRHTRPNGRCVQWDSFDVDVALEVMEQSQSSPS